MKEVENKHARGAVSKAYPRPIFCSVPERNNTIFFHAVLWCEVVGHLSKDQRGDVISCVFLRHIYFIIERATCFLTH